MSPTDDLLPASDQCPRCGKLRVITRALFTSAQGAHFGFQQTEKCECAEKTFAAVDMGAVIMAEMDAEARQVADGATLVEQGARPIARADPLVG